MIFNYIVLHWSKSAYWHFDAIVVETAFYCFDFDYCYFAEKFHSIFILRSEISCLFPICLSNPLGLIVMGPEVKNKYWQNWYTMSFKLQHLTTKPDRPFVKRMQLVFIYWLNFICCVHTKLPDDVNTICDGDLFINIDSVCPFQRLRSRWTFSSDSCYHDDIYIRYVL